MTSLRERSDGASLQISDANALFLDFDGTLVDIADRPTEVVVPSNLSGLLEQLWNYLGGALAIVSGRPVTELDVFLAPLRLPSIGVHGGERREKRDAIVSAAGEPGGLKSVRSVAADLGRAHPELYVEQKSVAVTVHYRGVPGLAHQIEDKLTDAASGIPDLEILRGKAVMSLWMFLKAQNIALGISTYLRPVRKNEKS